MYNDGRGIPIELHAKEKVYVPELIFGHLLTSSNYNDKEKKVSAAHIMLTRSAITTIAAGYDDGGKGSE